MKIRNPRTRNHLKIPRKFKVLEVGGGHNPHPRSNIIADKFVESNYHRSGDIKVYKHQEFIQADGEDLPFDDKEFDYVICNQVLEHVENPKKFISELSRVAKAGYLEVPSMVGEYIHPKKSHIWLILEIDEKIVMVDKETASFKPTHDLGDIFLDFLPKHSIGFKITQYTHGNIQTIRYEWKGEIDLVVNPTEDKYLSYFNNKWTEAQIEDMIPKKSIAGEFWEATKAFSYVLLCVFKSRIIKKLKWNL